MVDINSFLKGNRFMKELLRNKYLKYDNNGVFDDWKTQWKFYISCYYKVHRIMDIRKLKN